MDLQKNRLPDKPIHEDKHLIPPKLYTSGEDEMTPHLPTSALEIERAMSFLNSVITSPDPSEELATHPDQISWLLPALLDLNIRQARSDGRLDLAVALQDLKQLVDSHVATGDGKSDRPSELKKTGALVIPDRYQTRRMAVIEASLTRIGLLADPGLARAMDEDSAPEIVIACNPHLDPRALKTLAGFSARGVPIILDIGDDFEHFPIHHPDYERLGLGSPANARAFTAALLMADHITVPSTNLANALCSTHAPVSVIPDGWDSQNPFWTRPYPRRSTVNIGWIGNPGQLEDLFSIRRIILRVLHEFPETQLVIAGNARAFLMFDTIPLNRKLFLPAVTPGDYPYIFSQIDILLVPLGNLPYYLCQSDQVFVEAGVRSIPWIASPQPNALTWASGGATAATPEEWHSYLRQFILDEAMRSSIGDAGHQSAMTREAGRLAESWLLLLENSTASRSRSFN